MGNKNSHKKKKQKVDDKKNNNEQNEEDEMENYYSEIISKLKIDTEKIKNNLKKINKDDELIVLIESGSLAPPHKMHLNLMEITKKHFEQNDNKKKIIGGYIIPSSDRYVKEKLKDDFIPLEHRVNMTKLLIGNSDWLDYLDWGFAYGDEIKLLLEKILQKRFPEYHIKCILVFGIDYYLRSQSYLEYECVCVFRPGYDTEKIKEMYPENLIFVEGSNEDISSTILRKAFREKDEKIINELTCKEIVDYIKSNDIFNQNK